MTPSQRPLAMALTLFLLGCAAALLQGLYLQNDQGLKKTARFNALAERAVSQLSQRMLSYEHGLRGTRGVIITPGIDGITRARFREYSDSRDLQREFPGSRSYGFIRRVPLEQEAAFLESARLDGKPDFKIRYMTAHSGDRWIVQYSEPETSSQAAIGMDIASEGNRLKALQQAIQRNAATLTSPVTLAIAPEKINRGFLLLLPIYHSGMSIRTEEERLQAAGALAYTPLLIDEVLSGFDFRNGEFSLSLYDQSTEGIIQPFYHSIGTDEPVIEELAKQTPVQLYGRIWLVEIKALPRFISELNLLDPRYVALGIMGFAALLAVFLYIHLINSARRQQFLVDQARLAAIVASSSDAIIGKTLNDIVTSWNQAAEQTFGYSAKEAIGRPLSSLIVPPERLAEAADGLYRLQRGEPLPRLITQRRCRDGRLIDVAITLSPIRGADGRLVGSSTTLHDITEQKLAQQQLEQLNLALHERTAQAEAANQTKSEFLANMSHEIRTPMNAILGLCHLLKRQALTPVSRDMVQKIQVASRSLLGIINDILDLSKIEARHLELEQIDFPLNDVLDNLASIMSAAIDSKAIEVIIHPAPLAARHLRGDPLRLGQVLINLTANAIKFTDQGEVVVSIDCRQPDPAQNRLLLHFSVRDTGIGIPTDKQEAIFHAFTQADASTTRTFGGTGLGLTISRHLVELMGGSLQLTSHPGQGSEFSFEIPFAAASVPTSSPVEPLPPQHLLIADDHPIAREALAQLVTGLGWTAQSFASGTALLAHLQQPSSRCDLVLLDAQMPELDGLHTAQLIRRQLKYAALPIILMSTAQAHEHLQAQAGIQNIDLILSKPITESALYSAIQEAFIQRNESIPAPSEKSRLSNHHPLSGMRILVVDDSDINREVAESLLREAGARIALAADGQAALAILRDPDNSFDLVLMDVQMPIMDGYEATRQIRATPRLSKLPVIALTAGALDSQRQEAAACGMSAFIAKPFEVDELISLIQQQTLSPATNTTPSAQAINLMPSRPVPPMPQSAPISLINFERGLEVFQNPGQYQHYLQKFTQDYVQGLDAMAAADTPTLIALVHKIKGVAGTLGLEAVASQAANAEQRLREGQRAVASLAKLQEALDKTRSLIASYAPAPASSHAPSNLPPMQAADPERLKGLLADALRAMHSGALDGTETLLEELAQQFPANNLAPLHSALENFDFDGARRVLEGLALHLGIRLES